MYGNLVRLGMNMQSSLFFREFIFSLCRIFRLSNIKSTHEAKTPYKRISSALGIFKHGIICFSLTKFVRQILASLWASRFVHTVFSLLKKVTCKSVWPTPAVLASHVVHAFYMKVVYKKVVLEWSKP